jgi:hypothetical protein
MCWLRACLTNGSGCAEASCVSYNSELPGACQAILQLLVPSSGGQVAWLLLIRYLFFKAMIPLQSLVIVILDVTKSLLVTRKKN